MISRTLARVILGALLVGCVGGSGCAYALPDRTYPAWRAKAQAHGKQEAVFSAYACAKASPIVVKTGKTGVGVTIVFDGGDTTCPLALDAVTLTIAGREVARATPPPLPTLAPGVRVMMYFALPFDANASYNAGERSAVLALRHGAEQTAFDLDLIVDPTKEQP